MNTRSIASIAVNVYLDTPSLQEKQLERHEEETALRQAEINDRFNELKNLMAARVTPISPPLPTKPPDPPHYKYETDFLRFDGTKLRDWSRRCEEFFYLHQTPPEMKVRVASSSMMGLALQWHIHYMREHFGIFPSWTDYYIALFAKFGDDNDDLLRLSRAAFIPYYQNQYEASRLPLITSIEAPKSYEKKQENRTSELLCMLHEETNTLDHKLKHKQQHSVMKCEDASLARDETTQGTNSVSEEETKSNLASASHTVDTNKTQQKELIIEIGLIQEREALGIADSVLEVDYFQSQKLLPQLQSIELDGAKNHTKTWRIQDETSEKKEIKAGQIFQIHASSCLLKAWIEFRTYIKVFELTRKLQQSKVCLRELGEQVEAPEGVLGRRPRDPGRLTKQNWSREPIKRVWRSLLRIIESKHTVLTAYIWMSVKRQLTRERLDIQECEFDLRNNDELHTTLKGKEELRIQVKFLSREFEHNSLVVMHHVHKWEAHVVKHHVMYKWEETRCASLNTLNTVCVLIELWRHLTIMFLAETQLAVQEHYICLIVQKTWLQVVFLQRKQRTGKLYKETRRVQMVNDSFSIWHRWKNKNCKIYALASVECWFLLLQRGTVSDDMRLQRVIAVFGILDQKQVKADGRFLQKVLPWDHVKEYESRKGEANEMLSLEHCWMSSTFDRSDGLHVTVSAATIMQSFLESFDQFIVGLYNTSLGFFYGSLPRPPESNNSDFEGSMEPYIMKLCILNVISPLDSEVFHFQRPPELAETKEKRDQEFYKAFSYYP